MENIIQEIEYSIMVGEFRPKQKLVETDLMQYFSAGRGVVRDSLKILADRGLVVRNENRGATVIELSAKEIRDLYFLRSHLEGIGAELAFDRISSKDIEQMSKLQEELKNYTQVDRKLLKLHETLHEIIFRSYGNNFLLRQIKSLITIAGPVRYFSYTQPDLREKRIREHDEMIQSLKNSDKDRFIRLCQNHMIPGMEAYISIMYPHEVRNIKTN